MPVDGSNSERRTSPSFADAEAGKYPPQQIITAELTGN
jgi:hypothetical protein